MNTYTITGPGGLSERVLARSAEGAKRIVLSRNSKLKAGDLKASAEKRR